MANYQSIKTMNEDYRGFCEDIAILMLHLPDMNVMIEKFTINPQGRVSLTTTQDIPVNQLEHLGLS